MSIVKSRCRKWHRSLFCILAFYLFIDNRLFLNERLFVFQCSQNDEDKKVENIHGVTVFLLLFFFISNANKYITFNIICWTFRFGTTSYHWATYRQSNRSTTSRYTFNFLFSHCECVFFVLVNGRALKYGALSSGNGQRTVSNCGERCLRFTTCWTTVSHSLNGGDYKKNALW